MSAATRSALSKPDKRLSGKMFAFIFVGLLALALSAIVGGWWYRSQLRGREIMQVDVGGLILRLREGEAGRVQLFGETADSAIRWRQTFADTQHPARFQVIGDLVLFRARDPRGRPEVVAMDVETGKFRWRASGPMLAKDTAADVQQAHAEGWSHKSWEGPDQIACGSEIVEVYGKPSATLISRSQSSGDARVTRHFSGTIASVSTTDAQIVLNFQAGETETLACPLQPN